MIITTGVMTINELDRFTPTVHDTDGDIGGVSAWDTLHPERQLTFGECETEFEHAQRVADLRRRNPPSTQ